MAAIARVILRVAPKVIRNGGEDCAVEGKIIRFARELNRLESFVNEKFSTFQKGDRKLFDFYGLVGLIRFNRRFR